MTLFKVNKHSIEIKADKAKIFKEIVLWGESHWWPRNSNMKFINRSQGNVKEGTEYSMKIVPFGSSWDAKVTKLEPNYSIRRDFLDGMFSGFETVSILNADKGRPEVVYEMFYQINGRVNKLLWPAVEKVHNSNIKRILANLKQYVENNE